MENQIERGKKAFEKQQESNQLLREMRADADSITSMVKRLTNEVGLVAKQVQRNNTLISQNKDDDGEE